MESLMTSSLRFSSRCLGPNTSHQTKAFDPEQGKWLVQPPPASLCSVSSLEKTLQMKGLTWNQEVSCRAIHQNIELVLPPKLDGCVNCTLCICRQPYISSNGRRLQIGQNNGQRTFLESTMNTPKLTLGESSNEVVRVRSLQ